MERIPLSTLAYTRPAVKALQAIYFNDTLSADRLDSPGSSGVPTVPWWGKRTWRRLFPGRGCPGWWSCCQTYPEPGRNCLHSGRGLFKEGDGAVVSLNAITFNDILRGKNISVLLQVHTQRPGSELCFFESVLGFKFLKSSFCLDI